MKIMIIGATGTIGSAVAALLGQSHDVIRVGNTRGDFRVDLSSKESIGALFDAVGPVDAVVNTAGVANFGPFAQLSDADFRLALDNKLMGQVNLVRLAHDRVTDGGSITLTSGVLAQQPMAGSVAISMVNGALESFVKAAALEIGDRIRLNAVSPVFVKETMEMMGMDGAHGLPAADTAKAYKAGIDGDGTGETLDVRSFV